ncbi:hypothetical protein KJ359_002691 [Pestalotiopsis sp. 9143b]|nr:hypothetical protein KJ359_002691 [Pestalotiopsis sp. 9143b]
MKWYAVLPLFAAYHAQAKAVFAHFMVGNTADYTLATWSDDFSLAQDAHLDAFALNMAYGDTLNDDQVPIAFAAAESLGFKLFFSFDYAGNGAWPEADVKSMISKYSSSSAYFSVGGKPFVSTFEGPSNADDWTSIKSSTGCLFMPDWSSLGAKDATALGVADGLFSWAAWPTGPNNMNTYIDASYEEFMDASMPYMMAVSPWFYTNLPGYSKNWLWRGDSLWNDRWSEVLHWQPDYVELLTWNDYGESHYFGPIRDNTVLDVGKAPFDYVTGMPHDGWRALLPFWIDMYKTGTASVSEEVLVTWYRVNPASACSSGGTSGNTASQFQVEYPPAEIVQDRVYFNALLTSEAAVSVTIGGTAVTAEWSSKPWDGVGVYNGSAPINGLTGAVVVTVNGMSISGKEITTSCTDGYTNFNAWVGSTTKSVSAVSPEKNLSEQNCTSGWAVGNFEGLCATSCYYGYCPSGACLCTSMGPLNESPESTGVEGYPISGEGSSYSGLCSFDCNIGYCPDTACGTTEVELTEPTVSPFTPAACTSGSYTSDPNYAGLCSYACNYGFCPIYKCSCDSTGTLVLPPDTQDGESGEAIDSTDQSGLCEFACARGYCPAGACSYTGDDDTYVDDSGIVSHRTGSDSTTLPIDSTTCSYLDDWQPLHLATNDTLIKTSLSASERWDNSYAKEAYLCFEGWYLEAEKVDELGFFESWETALLYYMGCDSYQMKCLIDSGTNCEQDVSCPSANFTLAGYIVGGSMVRFTNFYTAWFDALDQVFATFDSSAFKEAFANGEEDSLVDQLDKWALNMIFEAVGAFVFKGVSVSLGASAGEKAERALGSSYETLTEWAVDKIVPSADEGVDISVIDKLINDTIVTQQAALESYVTDIFNGSGTSMAQLYNQINDGNWLHILWEQVSSIRETTEKFVMSQVIPAVWALAANPHIVIIVSDDEDDTSNPFAGGGLNADEAESVRYSYDGQTFWLVRLLKCTSYAYRTTTCDSNPWAPVHGHAAIETSDAWGLNKTDIIVSSNEGKKLNGGENGYVLKDASNGAYFINGNGDQSSWVYENGVQTPGVFSYPICSYELAHLNWAAINAEGSTKEMCSTYPCCSCDELGLTGDGC